MKRLCVFCGSSPGARPEYQAAARALGDAMVERGLGLVYGGGNVGLMGTLADAVLEGGGEVIGVIPRDLVKREVGHHGITRLEVVETLFERKGRMFELSDGFVSLPGGVGTLDELFEVMTWVQLGYLSKPCALLDVDGFYDGLQGLLDRLVAERFVRPEHRDLLWVEHQPAALLDRLERYETPPPTDGGKWIDRS
ncbi:MAG: TIGR00730 family Rossman fold protein [Myxococcota bacterium]|nr:TIGR00730 family Rossman fold protein [Myxococcota bacterium]